MNKTLIASLALVAFGAASASADIIPDRTTLDGILGGGGILEDFEALDISFRGQRADSGGLLNSTTMFDGSGPGLVQPGADYMAPTLWWNGDGYFNLNTQTLGDSSGWRGNAINIVYTTAVTAMGIDLQGYDGFSQAGTISVYDTSNNLISATAVDGGFFGWENAGGIGRVVVDATDGYIMIDNHLYGVPTPSTLAALGICGLAATRRRR